MVAGILIKRKIFVASVFCATSLLLRGELAFVPWVGDGRPICEEAAWYEKECAPEFKAEFVLSEGVKEASVHFACAGFASVRIGKDFFLTEDSGLHTLWSVYDKTVYSHTFGPLKVSSEDVKGGAPLKPYPAVNTIYVRLGNGFYNLLPLRFWGSICFRKNMAHGRPAFKLSIDGVKNPLVWKWRETNVIRNSVYLGTEIDATLPEKADWKNAAAVPGPKGEIVEWPKTNPQTRIIEMQEGKVRALGKGDVQVVDFGVNASAVPSFVFKGEKRGTRIEILYGERLNDDGSVNVLTQTAGQIKRRGRGGPGAPDIAAQRDVYICSGEAEKAGDGERFSPPFTWHVFRYAEIRGAKNLLLGSSAKRGVISMLPSEAEVSKNVKISDPNLKAIHEICLRTFKANLIGGIQSDCPGRERLGYGGDTLATCEAYMLNYDMREIYLKILRDFADEAKDDGWITETAPYTGIADCGFGARSGPISSTLVVPELMDGVLRHYNDKRALDYYPVCARYVRLVNAKCPSGIIPQCIGDHEALERAPNDVTATAHWFRFVSLTASFAKRLGLKDDAREFDSISRKIRAAFASKYVKGGVVANGTQSAQAIGIYLDLIPEDQRAAAFSKLVEAVESKGCAPHTGVFSTRYMLLALSENGRVDLARKIVLHKGFPGYLHMLERGATTLWETWKESDNVYSNCHPMFGSVDEWIIKFGAD